MDGTGIVETDVASGGEHAYGIQLQADGKLVAVGNARVSEETGTDGALMRLNSDGSLDSTFSGDGKETTDVGSALDAFWGGAAIQSDQRIVVAGKVHSIGTAPVTMAVLRYLPDGSLDTSFDGDGKVFTAFGGISIANSVVIDSDQKIVVAGRADGDSDYASSRTAIVRYNSDGSLDTTFGSTGVVTTDFGVGSVQSFNALVIQSDGKLVAAGSGHSLMVNGSYTHYRFLARYNTDGTLDSSFDGDGKVLFYSGTSDSTFFDIALQSDGKILASGWVAGVPYVARFNADGSLDSSFGDSGEVFRPDLSFGFTGLALQSDGKIILAARDDFAATRLNPDGSLDTSFAGTGTIQAVPSARVSNLIVQPDDKIVMTGGNDTSFVTVRLNRDGTFDSTFGSGLATKFYVVNDAAANLTYEYSRGGLSIDDYALNSGNSAPRGAASTAAGDKTWVVDANKKVYVYDTSGALLGSWTAGSLASNALVEGIATNGTDVWIVDARKDLVYRYTGAASRLSGSQNAASSFALNNNNRDPKDIVTDGTYLWVVNDSQFTDAIFKYTLSGSLVGSWTTSVRGSPTGITIDPTNVSDIWIVDNNDDRVYQYTAAASRTSGSQSPAVSFALAAGNTNPQGIADPPTQIGDTRRVLRQGRARLDAASVQQLFAEPERTWTRRSRIRLTAL
jgi:uncharacterized delta-60 repeat protein